jgi:hypothetical protein
VSQVFDVEESGTCGARANATAQLTNEAEPLPSTLVGLRCNSRELEQDAVAGAETLIGAPLANQPGGRRCRDRWPGESTRVLTGRQLDGSSD